MELFSYKVFINQRGWTCIERGLYGKMEPMESAATKESVMMIPEATSFKYNNTIMTQLVKVHRNTNLGMKLTVYDGRRVLYTAGKSKRGELSIFANSFNVLCHAVHMMPMQKSVKKVWTPGSGRISNAYILKDQETRYRQRYLDLMVNSEVRHIFKTRSAVISYIRRFLDNLDFLELFGIVPHASDARTLEIR